MAIAPRVTIPPVAGRALRPSTHAVLTHPTIEALRASLSHELLASLVRQAKETPLNGVRTKHEALNVVVAEVARTAASLVLPSRRLINATGIIIHTGLGTAPLSALARTRMLEAAGATATGAEGFAGRTNAADRLLRALTGAEAACVTVQNAAACTLLGAALANAREIVCAARDLLEISHGIRLQDLLETGGARVVPVGSANCVHLRDYTSAITDRTACVLRIWHSNYHATGYTTHVASDQLGRLAHAQRLPYVVNLGAGSLVDLRERGLPYSPTIQDALGWGADLVLASGDKLIGGPQAGIAVGRANLVHQLAAHPIYRAVRPAKLDIAALEGTLASYLAGRAWEEIPVLRMLSTSHEALRERAVSLARHARDTNLVVGLSPDTAACGGAALPSVELPTWTLRLTHLALGCDALYSALLRCGIATRRRDEVVLVDLRSVLPDDDSTVAAALAHIARREADGGIAQPA